MKLSSKQQKVWDRLKNGIPAESKPWTYSAAEIAPPNPQCGAVYYDTTMSVMRVYDGTSWKVVL